MDPATEVRAAVPAGIITPVEAAALLAVAAWLAGVALLIAQHLYA